MGGHCNIVATLCPGRNVYQLLPQLRTLVGRDVRSSAAMDGRATLLGSATAPSTLVLTVTNTGTTTWTGRYTLRALSLLPASYGVPGIVPGRHRQSPNDLAVAMLRDDSLSSALLPVGHFPDHRLDVRQESITLFSVVLQAHLPVQVALGQQLAGYSTLCRRQSMLG